MSVAVAFTEVAMTYPGNPPVHALSPTTLTIEKGDYVTIVGPSGSGKSTLLNIMGVLQRPTAGVYHLDGIDLAELSDDQRSALRGRKIGFVFQSFHLMPYRSAAENVALAQVYVGPTAKTRTRNALEALDRVGLSHRAHATPPHLSGGERQRVAIARALVNEPSLLLCDEPTGNLDSTTAASMLSLIDDVHAAGFTVVMITHDPKVAARGGRTITIEDGVLHG